ncbi:sigma-70 family RNA polymerase sigma factor [Fulvivirgaceae bacterium BMA10]|uniref:Sigma-70 family RNA polymerase sigma factor n=1 Tax=Splendidivirga corallicola TaxID=3051826 RepID=A0ABT8KMI5_9BACT|nr:sigma-70 family RNA polymerase sigma factor [Fulvivirgaceae bacterium BMA10]
MSLEDKFIEVVKENEGIIFKITTVYTNNADDQKDLYQEIVIQLWTAFRRFRNEAKVSTWIYRIALNTAITRIRKEKRKGDQVPIDQAILNYTENTNPEFEERLKILYRSIEALQELDKGIILLFLEDKSHEEISKIIGLSVSNVGTRLSRIRKKIKSQIANEQ